MGGLPFLAFTDAEARGSAALDGAAGSCAPASACCRDLLFDLRERLACLRCEVALDFLLELGFRELAPSCHASALLHASQDSADLVAPMRVRVPAWLGEYGVAPRLPVQCPP